MTPVSRHLAAPVARRSGHRLPVRAALAAGAIATLLGASACASEAPADAPAPDATSSAPATDGSSASTGDASSGASPVEVGTATVNVGEREFSFQLSTCMVVDEREAELAGQGGELGFEVPSHFDGGVMQMGADARGEFRIDIGAEGPFESSDEFLALGAPTGGDFSVERDGRGYRAIGNAWDANGTQLGTGTVVFACS